MTTTTIRPAVPTFPHPPALTSGRWRVATATSDYLLDLDAGVATRSPRRHAGATVPAMRGDDAPVLLRAVVLAEVGRPLVLVLARAGSGALTLRRSTPVRAITRLAVPDGPER